MSDCVIVGAGILGLAVADALSLARPGLQITVVDKEHELAQHQSGRNSGVIHSGIYYAPGSLKAQLCRSGRTALIEFAAEHGIAHDLCGKLIVATRDRELDALRSLHDRGQRHGLDVELLGPQAAGEIEPHLRCVGALRVASTGIIDFPAVCRALADRAIGRGVELRLGERVIGIEDDGDDRRIITDHGSLRARFIVTCGGQHSDRLARLEGGDPDAQIIPFRGEYYELAPDRSHLVRGLIYPTPDPALPFLGVHLTRSVDGHVHAGPNAVLALAREGYRKRDVDLTDVSEMLRYRGFWRLAAAHWRTGAYEVARSISRARFTASLQRLVPAIRAEDLRPAAPGIRAQAVRPDGALVDDFAFVERPRAVHVCNAPSPAATASLAIARTIVERVLGRLAEAGI